MAELERKHQLEKDTELMALKDAHATTTVQQQHLLEEANPTMAVHDRSASSSLQQPPPPSAAPLFALHRFVL